MAMIDVGPTYIDDFGRATPSDKILKLPPSMQSVINPNPTFAQPNGPIPMQAPAPVQAEQNAANIAPTPAAQGQQNLPKYSIPSDRYKEIESQAPQRDDPQFKQHGLAKFGNILA